LVRACRPVQDGAAIAELLISAASDAIIALMT